MGEGTLRSSIVLELKKCEQCVMEYRPTRRWQKFCSSVCRDRHHMTTWGNARQRSDETPEQFQARIRAYGQRKLNKYSNGHVDVGMCRACTQPTIGDQISWCEKHWLEQCAWRSGLRGGGWTEKLKKLLELQNFTCPYTGRKLVIGVNASIDHIQPRSRFPELVNCYENLEWVDVDVNRAKRSLTKEEFIALCDTVSGRHAWPNPERMATDCG